MDKYLSRKRSSSPAAVTQVSGCAGSLESDGNFKKKKSRKYDSEFIYLGFTDTNSRPQCFLCGKILSPDSMRSDKLEKHFKSLHSNFVGESKGFFERKLSSFRAQARSFFDNCVQTCDTTEASLKVAYRIAKGGFPHTIAEDLVLPCIKEVTTIMCGKSSAEKLSVVPLSDNTISRRINEMSDDVLYQLLSKVRVSPFFSLQLDESTDCSNSAQLMCFIRYVDAKKIDEDFLFCKILEQTATAADIFRTLDTFINKHELNWSKCVSLCTDGARVMSGHKSGVAARVRELSPECLWFHCSIHKEALAAKNMPNELSSVLQAVVQIVNLIKHRPLNSRLFSTLCEEMGSQHKHLLLHTEVRWLSRGKILGRVFELREECRLFLLSIKSDKHSYFSDEKFVLRLSYLADIFGKLNDLNRSMQGSNSNILTNVDKIQGFRRKLRLWETLASKNDFSAFDNLTGLLLPANVEVIRDLVIEHISMLQTSFKKYFEDSITVENQQWIRDPFSTVVESVNLPLPEKETLVDLSCDSLLQQQMKTVSIDQFWAQLRSADPQSSGTDYSVLCDHALKMLVHFSSTYLCESAFSKLTYLKSKYRNRLEVEPDLRLNLSSITPRFKQLSGARQQQPSH